MTTQESYDTPTYRIDEADKTGQIVNSIPGLTEANADLVAAALRQGTAYVAGERTATVARELTAAEQLAAAVVDWRAAELSDTRTMSSTGELAACLLSLAAMLTATGDIEIEPTALRVALRVAPGKLTTSTAPAATVDVLASLLAMVPESSSTAYGLSRSAGGVGAPVYVSAYGLTSPDTVPLAVEAAAPALPSEPEPLSVAEVRLMLRQWEAYGPEFDVAKVNPEFRHVVLHVAAAEGVDRFAELLTDAGKNIAELYGDRTYEVMGTHADLPGWTVFVQRHEPAEVRAAAARIVADLGTYPPSVDLNARIEGLPEFKVVLKYTTQKIVSFALLGQPRIVISYDRPTKSWVMGS